MAPTIGLSTASVYPESTAHAFGWAASLGYDAVEVMVGIDSLSQQADAVKKLSDHHGVPICAVHAPCLLFTQRVWGTDPWGKLEKSAGMARETSRIRLGTLVSPVTFRLPGPLAICVAQVDAMSGGRVELGLGAGLVRRASTRRTASRTRPTPRSGSTSSRSSSRSSPACGRRRSARRSRTRASTTSSADSPALPKPVQQPARRS